MHDDFGSKCKVAKPVLIQLDANWKSETWEVVDTEI